MSDLQYPLVHLCAESLPNLEEDARLKVIISEFFNDMEQLKRSSNTMIVRKILNSAI